jgi:hypothetical protein
MVNGTFDELSFQARLTSERAYHRNTLFALRSLCCIDLPAVQGECREASGEWPTVRCGARPSGTEDVYTLYAKSFKGSKATVDMPGSWEWPCS